MNVNEVDIGGAKSLEKVVFFIQTLQSASSCENEDETDIPTIATYQGNFISC